MIDATITYINQQITDAFSCGVSLQFVGRSKRVQRDKQTINTVVTSNDAVTPFVIDDLFDVQVFHVEKNWIATKNPFNQYSWRCNLRLVGIASATKHIDTIMMALEQNESIIIESANFNSLDVIKNLWLADDWNPESYAFSVDYNVNTIHVPTRTEAFKMIEIAATYAY